MAKEKHGENRMSRVSQKCIVVITIQVVVTTAGVPGLRHLSY